MYEAMLSMNSMLSMKLVQPFSDLKEFFNSYLESLKKVVNKATK